MFAFALASEAPADSPLLTTLFVVLAGAGVAALIAQRLRMAAIPAYLFIGAVIGPNALGLVEAGPGLESLQSLALVLLMFGIGLLLDTTSFRGALGRIVFIGIAAVSGTILLLWPLCLVFGLHAPSALVIAIAFANSSTAIVMRVLQAKRQTQRISGRLCLALLIVQDLSVILALIALPIIGVWAGVATDLVDPEATGFARLGELLANGGLALAGVGALIAFGKFVLPFILREAARVGSTEILTILSVAFAIGAAGLTSLLGLSLELGAFLGGFLLSSTPFRHHLSGQIGTIRDLFLAVFFTALGLSISFADIAANLPLVIFGTLGLVLLKGLAIALSCWFSGTTVGSALKVGLSLAQASEFGLVILTVAGPTGVGILDSVVLGKATAIVALTLLFTPFLMSLADLINDRFNLTQTAPWIKKATLVDADERADFIEKHDDILRRHIIVAGFGVIGRAVVDRLAHTDTTITIIEMNLQTVRTQTRHGKSILYGDVSDPEVLESAGIHDADALILAIPDEEAVLRACRTAKHLNPDVYIVARTNFLSRAMIAISLGANETVVEEMATAEAMDRLIQRVLERHEAEDNSRRESAQRARHAQESRSESPSDASQDGAEDPKQESRNED